MPQAMIMREEFWIRMSRTTRMDMNFGSMAAMTTIITSIQIMMTLLLRKWRMLF